MTDIASGRPEFHAERRAEDARGLRGIGALKPPALAWAALLVVSACMFGLFLGRAALIDPDEGRHAEIAREMLRSGNFLTPTLEGRAYHDKPVLYYWLAAAAMAVFGEREWAARLPSAVSAAVGVGATAWWGMRFLDPLTGTAAALILATTGMYAVLGRVVLLDMLFSACLAMAFLYAIAWSLSARRPRPPLWPFYVLLALATLTKGPVAPVLALLCLAPVAYRAGVRVGELRLVRGAALFLAVAGSWYLGAAVMAPDYMREFLWRHNVERFTTGGVGHPGNPFVYVVILPATFLPWSLYWPAAMLRARRLRPLPSRPLEACMWWAGAVFVFFSISHAKLATYLLPLFPPLALLTAAGLAGALRGERLAGSEARAHRLAFYAVTLLAVAAPVAALVLARKLGLSHAAGPLALAFAGLPVPVVLGFRWLRAQQFDRALAAVGFVMLALVVGLYGMAARSVSEAFSLKGAAELLRLLPEEPRVYGLGAHVGSLAFYLRRPVEKLDGFAEAADRLAAAEPAAVVAKRKALRPLVPLLRRPAYVWWHNWKRALIVNRPPPPESGLPPDPLLPVQPSG